MKKKDLIPSVAPRHETSPAPLFPSPKDSSRGVFVFRGESGELFMQQLRITSQCIASYRTRAVVGGGGGGWWRHGHGMAWRTVEVAGTLINRTAAIELTVLVPVSSACHPLMEGP